MAINHELVRAECEAQTGFVDSTAYNRTKICCRILTQHGEAIPSWMVVREIIGKGSSGDINRGIKDFRQDHAERLRQMDGVLPGVPEHLAPLVSAFWEAAVLAARNEFTSNALRWQEQIEQAEARADLAGQQLTEAQGVIERQCSQIEAQGTTISALESQVTTERAGREQAERMFETHTAEMTAQREKLEATLKENKIEMDRALERFNGERKYAMCQIDEARTKATNDIAAANAQAQREKNTLELEAARQSNVIADLRAKLNDSDRTVAVMAQEVTDLRARLGRTEASNDQLTQDNRKMIALMKNSGTTVNTRGRRVSTIRKGNKR